MAQPHKILPTQKPRKNEDLILFLIDDDEDDRELFLIAAADLPYPVNCMCSYKCSDALQAFHNGHLPDLIFLDLNMPKMSGKECLSEFKKDARLKNIPVIIFTTSSDSEDKKDILALGATDFITKPPHLQQLTNLLDQVITKVLEKDLKKHI